MCSSISLLTAGIWSATKWPPPASTSKRLGPRRKRRYPRPRADRIVIVAPVVKRGDADRAERRADGAAGAIPCKRGLHGLLVTEHSDVFPSRSRVRRPLSIARSHLANPCSSNRSGRVALARYERIECQTGRNRNRRLGHLRAPHLEPGCSRLTF